MLRTRRMRRLQVTLCRFGCFEIPELSLAAREC